MKTKIYSLLLVAFLLAVLSGCGGPPRPEQTIGWPADNPRIEFVKSIYGSFDVDPGFWDKLKAFFFGKSKPVRIGKPYGVTHDRNSKLYIADTAKKGVLIIDLGSGKTRFINAVSDDLTLVEPVYVTLDNSGRIYIADTGLGKVIVLNSDYSFSHAIGQEGGLTAPVGLAFSPDYSRLYVVDTRGHKVLIYSLSGEELGSFGKRGDDKGEFHFPLTIAVADDGRIYIVDSFHFTVQVFDESGTYLGSIGRAADGSIGKLARPRDIAIDSDNNIYVTDAMRNNVQIYDDDGNLLLAFGRVGVEDGDFRLPAGIYIDDNDTIYIADSVNERVQIFKYISEH